MKINTVVLGISIGILWGLIVFAAVWDIHLRGGTGEHLVLLNRFYPGFTISPLGSVIGLLYGFVSGFIGGWIVGGLYNILSGQQSA